MKWLYLVCGIVLVAGGIAGFFFAEIRWKMSFCFLFGFYYLFKAYRKFQEAKIEAACKDINCQDCAGFRGGSCPGKDE